MPITTHLTINMIQSFVDKLRAIAMQETADGRVTSDSGATVERILNQQIYILVSTRSPEIRVAIKSSETGQWQPVLDVDATGALNRWESFHLLPNGRTWVDEISAFPIEPQPPALKAGALLEFLLMQWLQNHDAKTTALYLDCEFVVFMLFSALEECQSFLPTVVTTTDNQYSLAEDAEAPWQALLAQVNLAIAIALGQVEVNYTEALV